MNITDAKSRVIATKFSWNGVSPAPFGLLHNYSFQVDESYTHPITVELLTSTALIISRFIGTFNVISRCLDISVYQNLMAGLLIRAGFNNSELLPAIAWPIIMDGLNKYAISLNEILLLAQPDSEFIKIPISPMHLWALTETARAYLACDVKDQTNKDFVDDCHAILHYTEHEAAQVSEQALPYVNLK